MADPRDGRSPCYPYFRWIFLRLAVLEAAILRQERGDVPQTEAVGVKLTALLPYRVTKVAPTTRKLFFGRS